MSEKYQEPNAVFQLSTGERDGFPIVAVLNTVFVGDRRCGEFPWLLELEIAAADVDERGFPEPAEVDRLNQIEERLQESLVPVGTRFIARQTWNARRLLDYYVADRDAARRRVDEFIRRNASDRKIEFRLTRDESWDTWMPTLIGMREPDSEPTIGGADDEQAVLVRIPLKGGQFGSDAEQEQVVALSDALTEIVAESDVGVFDGYEFGNGEAVLFAYGPDADELFAAFKPALRKAKLGRGAVVIRRYGAAEDAREKTVRI